MNASHYIHHTRTGNRSGSDFCSDSDHGIAPPVPAGVVVLVPAPLLLLLLWYWW